MELSDMSDDALLERLKDRAKQALALITVNPDAAFTVMQESEAARAELLRRYPS